MALPQIDHFAARFISLHCMKWFNIFHVPALKARMVRKTHRSTNVTLPFIYATCMTNPSKSRRQQFLNLWLLMTPTHSEIVRHHTGKAWGHQCFSVFLKGKPDPYYGKNFCRQRGMASDKAFFFGVRRRGSRLRRWDRTKPLRGFFVLVTSPAACMWMTSKGALPGTLWAFFELDTIVSNYQIIISYEFRIVAKWEALPEPFCKPSRRCHNGFLFYYILNVLTGACHTSTIFLCVYHCFSVHLLDDCKANEEEKQWKDSLTLQKLINTNLRLIERCWRDIS